MVRDSAGIRIVGNGEVEELPTVRLRRPELRVGWTDDGPWFDRIQGGSLLAEGGAVVADDRTPRIWVIDAQGAATGFGERGEGPGELTWPGHVFELDDGTLIVHDYGVDRPLRFTRQGDFIAAGPRHRVRGVGLRPVRQLASGRVGWEPMGIAAGTLRYDDGGWIPLPVAAGEPLAGPTDTLATFRGYLQGEPGAPVRFTDPFAEMRMVGISRSGPVIARSDLPDVRWHDETGALTQVARWRQEPHPVDDEVWEAYVRVRESRNATSPERVDDARMERMLDEARRAASPSMPRFSWVTVGGDGQVWLAESPFLGGTDGRVRRFLRVSPDGRVLGWVEFARPIHTILDVDGRRVLVVERDDYDVEAVAIYELPD